MKIVLSFKQPDVIDEAIANEGEVSDNAEAAIRRTCNKFVEYGEYIRVEVDTDKGTATVLPV